MTARTYWVESEGAGFLRDKPFRRLETAQEFAAKAAEECSWECLTPPAPDNEVSPGRGNFRCGVTAPHGIHIRAAEDGVWREEYDAPDEKFRQAKGAGKQVDWTLSVIIDRGTGYLADGEDTLYYVGPEQTDTGWDQILDDIAGSDEIVEATVRPTPFGRYSHLVGSDSDYPMKWKQGYGF